MNFRDLEYAIEAAKTLSFSKAAQICHVSQPSLSAQIKKLEEELGAELFIRSKRKIHLTGYGESFVEIATDILKRREDMYRLANESKNTLEGRISLGGILTVAPYIFPKIVKKINADLPNIKLSLKEAKTADLLKDLLDGSIDAAIVSLPTDDNVFDSRPLFTEPFYVAVPKTHRLADKTTISDADLDNETLLLLEEGHCFRAQALDVCRTSSAKENSTFRATSLETIRHFIAIGEGITLMPAIARQDADNIVYIPFQKEKVSRQIGVIWRRSSSKTPQIEKLAGLMETFLIDKIA